MAVKMPVDLVSLELGDLLAFDLRSIFAGLVPHPLQQLLAFDPVGIAGVIAGAGDPCCAALAAVDHEDVEVEAGEIDGGGQPGRAAADDQAIENGLVHAQPNGL